EVLSYYDIDCTGKEAAVIGRSLVVGRPLAMLLMHKNATVTVCHTRTKDVAKHAKEADILVVCSGQMESFGEEYVRPGQTVLDVGISWNEEKQKLLLTLAEKRGLIVLTDSDSAGFMIRNFIGNKVPKEYITDVYIPDIFGKEKRKAQPSAEGKLGVEGVPEKVLAEALEKFGEGKSESDERKITRLDFYEDGLMGGPD
ncbi:MAG: DUF4093 domain-containing protein, partial [Clostridia bacterium]|nr:DUF4093 domain-containing protein [Clostridia bacterium]